MEKPRIKQNATIFIASFWVVFGLWNIVRWRSNINLPLENISLWGGLMLSAGAALIFLGIFYYGNLLIRDTRRLYQISNQRLNIPSIKWIRFLNPVGPFYNLYRHRDLLRQFVRRDIEGRYKGSFLGLIWSFMNPLLMLMIYSFVFSIVFKARWRSQGEVNLGEFAITLFAGLIAFNIFSETVNRAPGLIIGNPNYVKKVVFPLEILPVSALGSTIFHGLISIAILIAGNLLILGTLSPMIFLLPLVILPLLWLTLGLSWILEVEPLAATAM